MRSPNFGPEVSPFFRFVSFLPLILRSFLNRIGTGATLDPLYGHTSNCRSPRPQAAPCFFPLLHFALIALPLWALSKWFLVGALAIFLLQAALIVILIVQGAWVQRAKDALLDALRFDQLISEIFARFMDRLPNSVDSIVERSLRQIQNFLKLDSCDLLQVQSDKGQVRVASAWFSRNAETPPELTDFPLLFPYCIKRAVSRRLTAIVRGPGDLPPEADEDRKSFQALGIRSLALVPLTSGASVSHLMVVQVKQEVELEKCDSRLRLLGAMCVNALERARTHQILRKSESMEGAILESLKSHLAVLNEQGQITTVNSAWIEFQFVAEKTASIEASAGVGANYLDLYRRAAASGVPRAADAYAGIRAVLEGAREHFELEHCCDLPQGERWFEMTVTQLKSDDKGAIVVHREITAQKQLEFAIRDSEARFRYVADAAPMMIWMSGSDKRCNYFSKKWLEFTGRSVEQQEGNGWIQCIHPADRENFALTYSDEFDAQREFKKEFRLRRFDGEYRCVLNVGVPRYGPGKEFLGYIGCCIDIEERRVAEAAILEVSGRLIAAQEAERARIARELHDNLSQRMAMLEIGIEQLKEKPSELSLAAKRHLNDIEKIANEISSDIHHLSHRLHPSKLNNLGLVATLHGLCKEISDQSGVKIHFTYRNVPRMLSGDVSLCLYRVSQEALNNVVKHSSAREGKVDVSGSNDSIELCISDAGVGFDPELAKEKTGLGLISMRERLRLVGGQLSVESEPFHGTQVCARVPLVDRAIAGEIDSTPRVTTAEDREVPHA
jgi:PAS domain S-box-containing protein